MHPIDLNFGRFFRREHGFTLPELLATISILGIILAIVVPSWHSATASRELDSATNQLTSDLRLAHSRATNRLVSYEVNVTPGARAYQMGGDPRSLPENTKVTSADEQDITFLATGGVDPDDESVLTVTVGAGDEGPSRDITVNTATSRVESAPVEDSS